MQINILYYRPIFITSLYWKINSMNTTEVYFFKMFYAYLIIDTENYCALIFAKTFTFDVY